MAHYFSLLIKKAQAKKIKQKICPKVKVINLAFLYISIVALNCLIGKVNIQRTITQQ